MIEQQRINAILQIRLDGAEAWDVRAYIAEKEEAGEEPWKVEDERNPLSAAQIGDIIQAADDLIAAASPGDAPEVARHKAKLKSLYARAVQAGDVRTARSILTDLAKMEGLNRRKPSTPIVPSKASEATAKLREKLKKGKG